jgi:hypothetical protein
LEPVVIDVVGEVVDQAGVLHAQHRCCQLGVKIGDELRDPGLSTGRGCGRGPGELAVR